MESIHGNMGIVVSYLAVELQQEPHLWWNDEHADQEVDVHAASDEQNTDAISPSATIKKSDTASYKNIIQNRSIRWSLANAIAETKNVNVGITIPPSFTSPYNRVNDGSPFPYYRGSLVDYRGYTLHRDEFVLALIRCFNLSHFDSSLYRENTLLIAYRIIDDIVNLRVVAETLKRQVDAFDLDLVDAREALETERSTRPSNVCLVEDEDFPCINNKV